MPALGTVTVRHYRFRNDDGTEVTATWLAGEDTGATVHPTADQNFRLRLGIDQTDSGSFAATYGLQVAKNGGAAATVGNASSNVRGVVTANLTDGANTTNQLTVPGGDTYVTEPGVVDQTAATSASITLTTNQDTELEWSLILKFADVAVGDYLDFTILKASGTLAVFQYGGTIRLTIGAPNPTTSEKFGALGEQEGGAEAGKHMAGVLPD